MIFSPSALCGALLFLLPTLTSAYNSGKDDIVPPREWHEIYIEPKDIKDLPQAGYGNGKKERLVYFVDNDHAIVGDINIGLVKNLKDHGTGKRRKSKRAHSIFPSDTFQRWPDATLKYKYVDAAAEEGLKPLVDQALAYWTAVAPYVKFVQLRTTDTYQPGTLLIKMTQGAGACWSPIGWCDGCDLTMQLDVWNCNVNTYVHEFGHALGLQHEHQRPDRDDYMTFNCSALSDYAKYGTSDSSCVGDPNKCCQEATCWGWACAFNHITWQDWHGPLDLKSVMMYTMWTFSGGVSPVLEGIGNYKVSSFDFPNPSEGDKLRICEIYHEQCNAVPPVCGNGRIEYPEECDDGNTKDGDGCSSKCTIEVFPPGTKCEVCHPSPIENKCDITTSCISTDPKSSHYCACRAGYKANPGYSSTDLIEWRMPFSGQEYRVFVKPGVICDTLCESWESGGKNGILCGEVQMKNDCK